MKKRNRYKEVKVATRKQKADLAINNINLIDVFNSTILKNQSVAIVDSVIVGVSKKPYEAKKVIDGKNKHLIPGLIDPHIHVESSYINPEEFVKTVARHGTTTTIVDCHEIANTNGNEGIDYFLKFTDSPFNFLLWIPSCVPASKWEHGLKKLEIEQIEKYFKNSYVKGLGEMMDFNGVISGKKEVIKKVESAFDHNLLTDGHIPFVVDDNLNAYLSQNISAEHESTTKEEVLEKVSKGIHINLRYGDECQNLPDLINLVNKNNLSYFSICGDDINASTLLREGHLNRAYHAVKNKIENISKIDLIKMMTINTARSNNMRFDGAIAPGYKANLVVIDNLDSFNIKTTIANGKIIWDGKKTKNLNFNVQFPTSIFKHKIFKDSDFKVNYLTQNEKAIIANGFSTSKTEIKVINENSQAKAISKDVAKVSIIDRYNRTKVDNFTCFIDKFGLEKGAFAQTINHDSHNTVVVGKSENDMALAVNEIKNQKGGFVATYNNKVIARLKLPVSGLMSNKKTNDFIKEWNTFFDKIKPIFAKNNENPVLKLRGIGLTVIPEYRMSLFGLFDVEKNKIVKKNFKWKQKIS